MTVFHVWAYQLGMTVVTVVVMSCGLALAFAKHAVIERITHGHHRIPRR